MCQLKAAVGPSLGIDLDNWRLTDMDYADDIALFSPSSEDLSSVLRILNLHSHDLRVPVGNLSRFKLSLPQCNVPGVLNCMSGRLSGCPSLY